MIEEYEAFPVSKETIGKVIGLYLDILSQIDDSDQEKIDLVNKFSALASNVDSLSEPINLGGSLENIMKIIEAVSENAIMKVNIRSNPTINRLVAQFNTLTEKVLDETCILYTLITGTPLHQLYVLRFTLDAEENRICRHLKQFEEHLLYLSEEGLRSLNSVFGGEGSI